jgi:hypothetical protein
MKTGLTPVNDTGEKFSLVESKQNINQMEKHHENSHCNLKHRYE